MFGITSTYCEDGLGIIAGSGACLCVGGNICGFWKLTGLLHNQTRSQQDPRAQAERRWDPESWWRHCCPCGVMVILWWGRTHCDGDCEGSDTLSVGTSFGIGSLRKLFRGWTHVAGEQLFISVFWFNFIATRSSESNKNYKKQHLDFFCKHIRFDLLEDNPVFHAESRRVTYECSMSHCDMLTQLTLLRFLCSWCPMVNGQLRLGTMTWTDLKKISGVLWGRGQLGPRPGLILSDPDEELHETTKRRKFKQDANKEKRPRRRSHLWPRARSPLSQKGVRW